MFTEEKEKKSKSMVFGIVALVITLGLMGYFLFYTGDNGNNSNGVEQMQELAGQVQSMETAVKKKEGELYNLAEAYKDQSGQNKAIGFNPLDLSPEARELLRQRIAVEHDVSIKSLLEDILKKNEEIEDLREKIARIEKLLPSPHIVAEGENHYQIAMEFLINQIGLDKEEAVDLLERTALFDELAPGFKVWNFYSGDEYGTSVSQGDADISPNLLIHLAKKKLTDDRNSALAERDKLASNIKTLEEREQENSAQLKLLNEEREGLVNTVSDLTQQVNSLYYLLDSRQNLKKKGILKSRFLTSAKVRDVSPEWFNCSIDLRTKNQLLIAAKDLGIKKIKDVSLYPNIYREGNSYKIEMTADKRYALLTILKKDKFKNERLVIAIR